MKSKSKQSRKSKQIRSYKYEFSQNSVSSLGGPSLTEYLANPLGLWKNLQDQVPDRQGKYDRTTTLRTTLSEIVLTVA